MKTQWIAGAVAGSVILASLGLASGDALAQTSLNVAQDQAQLNADTQALARERAQLNSDERALGEHATSGRMSAVSKDDQRVYRDIRAIAGERKDTARDRLGSLQREADGAASRRERTQLRADEAQLREDAMSGRMSAVSPDAEKVYKDQQAITAQERAIRTDRAQLKADEKK